MKVSESSRDVMDGIRYVLKWKAPPEEDSLKIKPFTLYTSVLPGVGYLLETGFSAVLTVNESFYTYRAREANISAITIEVNYTEKKQFYLPVITDIWTAGNKFNFVGDYRYYKFPSVTYGLGSVSKLNDAVNIDFSYFRFYQSGLMQVWPGLMAGVGYALDYHWNIKRLTPVNEKTVIDKYGLTSRSTSSGISANVLFDTRKNVNNPVAGGSFASVLYRPNFTFLGSSTNWQYLLIDLRKYVRFPAGSENILAFWNFYWMDISGKAPYLDLPTTGWDTYANSGRGYIQERFRGQRMIYLESEYRFRILKNGLLGGTVFANVESYSNYPSNTFEAFLPAAGLGIRLKINKISNTNLAVDYGFGLNGSRGLFFNLGEVF